MEEGRREGGGRERRKEGRERRKKEKEGGKQAAGQVRCYFYKLVLLRFEILDFLILSGLDTK